MLEKLAGSYNITQYGTSLKILQARSNLIKGPNCGERKSNGREIWVNKRDIIKDYKKFWLKCVQTGMKTEGEKNIWGVVAEEKLRIYEKDFYSVRKCYKSLTTLRLK